jgi:hypothetical protein
MISVSVDHRGLQLHCSHQCVKLCFYKNVAQVETVEHTTAHYYISETVLSKNTYFLRSDIEFTFLCHISFGIFI